MTWKCDELPEECQNCIHLKAFKLYVDLDKYASIEIPEPHGDLIDRSRLSVIPITDYKLEGHLVVEIEDIENAPAILEASK